MAKSNIQESQQQGQSITIGTQGNEDQPTPLGNDLHQQQNRQNDQHIPNQENSSAANQRKVSDDSGQNS